MVDIETHSRILGGHYANIRERILLALLNNQNYTPDKTTAGFVDELINVMFGIPDNKSTSKLHVAF